MAILELTSLVCMETTLVLRLSLYPFCPCVSVLSLCSLLIRSLSLSPCLCSPALSYHCSCIRVIAGTGEQEQANVIGFTLELP